MLPSTDIWVGALIRRVELGGGFAYVARKGDARAGAVIVKVLDLNSFETRLYRAATRYREEGEDTVWSPVANTDEGYIERQVRYDPDLWVIEIEDKGGRTFLTEKVEGD